ncbi:hypothetical protein DL767_005127 [Monosporascus sp. MG133]|nr:hypothetical protein DL767_005127 [Monosporascus sp. MG133]
MQVPRSWYGLELPMRNHVGPSGASGQGADPSLMERGIWCKALLPLAFLGRTGVLSGPVVLGRDESAYTHGSCVTKYGSKSADRAPRYTKTHLITLTDGKGVQEPERYPKAVYCHTGVKVATTSAAAPSTVTITSTNTQSSTGTEVPVRASAKVTESTTETFTTTTTTTNEVTTTITNTETVAAAPMATASNFVGSHNGNNIQSIYFPTAIRGFGSLSAPDALGCCEVCQRTPGLQRFTCYDGNCLLPVPDTCAPANMVGCYGAPDNNAVAGYNVGNQLWRPVVGPGP